MICLTVVQYLGDQVPANDDVLGLQVKMDDAVVD